MKQKFSCQELADRHEILYVRSLRLLTETRILQYSQQKSVAMAGSLDGEAQEKLLELQRDMQRLRAEDLRLQADIIEHHLEHEEGRCKHFGSEDHGLFSGVQIPDSLPPNL